MQTKQQKRRRGVILTEQGLKKLEVAKFKENDQKPYTLEALSERTGLARDTLIKVCAGNTRVDKRTLNRYFQAFNLSLESSDYSSTGFQIEENIQKDWKIAPFLQPQDWLLPQNVSTFFGRKSELTALKQWIESEHCQLVTLLGMGGVGKTSLTEKLIAELKDPFDFVIWQSLEDAPPINNLLAELIQFFSPQKTNQPTTVYSQVVKLFSYLSQHRCLLIFDNFETIVPKQSQVDGLYGENNYSCHYQGYSELLKQFGTTSHQSCLLLLSRQMPKEIKLLQDPSLPVRLMQLEGLPVEEGQKILTSITSLKSWKSELVEYYGGNPLALKIAAKKIERLFDGNIEIFLQQNGAVLDELSQFIEEQLYGLSEVTQQMINWLAINLESVSFPQLVLSLGDYFFTAQLLEGFQFLQERSLIELQDNKFTLQPLVGEYVRRKVINHGINN